MELRNEAEELALALELGFASVDEAVRWADERIEQLPQPSYALIQVSLAARLPRVEVAHLLRDVSGDPSIGAIARRVIGRMHAELEGGRSTGSRVAEALYHMYLNDQFPDEKAGRDMASLNETFHLAREGIYGSMEEAERELRDFLERYR